VLKVPSGTGGGQNVGDETGDRIPNRNSGVTRQRAWARAKPMRGLEYLSMDTDRLNGPLCRSGRILSDLEQHIGSSEEERRFQRA